MFGPSAICLAGFMAGRRRENAFLLTISMAIGGDEGIRTLETVSRLHP
jgi:hypothetical protein